MSPIRSRTRTDAEAVRDPIEEADAPRCAGWLGPQRQRRPDDERSETRMMLDDAIAPAATTLDLLADTLNLRDVGGHVTAGGRQVTEGLAYRSAELRPTDDGDVRAALADLGLRIVYDLRTAYERAQHPDDVPPGAELVVLDVFSDDGNVAPAQLESIVADPRQAEALVGDCKVHSALQQAYRGLVSLPSARFAYRQLLTELSDDSTGTALFHCTAGKDRAGWAAAALLLYLGVPEDDVMADYLAGNEATRHLFQPQLDAYEAAGGNPAMLAPLFEVQESYLAAALDEMRRLYHDITGYVSVGLRINVEAQYRLRHRFLM